MKRFFTYTNLRTALLIFVVEFVILEPLMLAFNVLTAQADVTPTPVLNYDADCLQTATNFYTTGAVPDFLNPNIQQPITTPQEDPAASSFDTGNSDPYTVPDPPVSNPPTDSAIWGGESPFLEAFDLAGIKNNPLIPDDIKKQLTSNDYIDAIFNKFGPTGLAHYVDASKGIDVVVSCRSDGGIESSNYLDPSLFDGLLPLSPESEDYFNLLSDPTPKITFANELDYWALTGETCRGGLSANWQNTGKPCPNFSNQDDVFANNAWDAPKADDRTLRTLDYLITPVNQGGAGREHLRIKRIIQYGKNDILAPPPTPTPDPNLPDDSSTSLLKSIIPVAHAADVPPADDPTVIENDDNSADTTAATDPTQEPSVAKDDGSGLNLNSKCYVDPQDDPVSPSTISTCLEIDQIDNVRVGTKIVKKRLLGNNSTSYQYQAPFPVNVSWQSDQGLQQDPPPNFSQLALLGVSKISVNRMIIELLNKYGLGDLNLDVSTMNVNSFADVGLIVGQSIVEQLLGTPRGSMKGWSLASVMNSIGRAYLEQQLGLIPGTLSSGNSYQDIVKNIGRVTMEYVMQLPQGSLQTQDGSSQQTLESIGRRYLESQVLKVSPGTLIPKVAGDIPVDEQDYLSQLGIDPTDLAGQSFPINTLNDLMERLGEGALEYAFKLPNQSLRKTAYDSGDVTTSFRESSYKATLLFAKPAAAADFDMDDYITSTLNLNFVESTPGSGKSRYGFSKDEFDNPVVKLQTGQMSLVRFKQLIGSKVIENSLGLFKPSGVDGSQVVNGNAQTFNSRIPVEEYSERFLPGQNIPDPTYNNVPVVADTTTARIGPPDPDGFPNNNWCSQAREEYLVKLQQGAGRVNVACKVTLAASPTKDLDVLEAVRQSFLTSTVNYRYTFTAHPDQEPIYNDPSLVFDGPNRPYNTAERDYYNKYTTQVPTNTIAPFNSDKMAATDPRVVGSTVIDTLNSLSFIKNDSDFQKRLKMLTDMYNRDGNSTVYQMPKLVTDYAKAHSQISDPTFHATTKNYFDLTPVVDQPGTNLDVQVINRLNRVAAYPAPSDVDPTQYLSQYDKPDLNGWIFMMQDLKSRMQCYLSGGSFEYSIDDGVYACTPATSGAKLLSESDKYYLTGAIKQIDDITGQMNALTTAYMNILDRGSAQQTIKVVGPKGGSASFGGQSAMSAAIGVPGQVYQTDDNGRIDPSTTNALFRADPARALVAADFNSDNTVNTNYAFQQGGVDNFLTNIRMIGLVYASKKFTGDPLAQRRFITQLKASVSSTVNGAAGKLIKIGLNTSTLQTLGLTNPDFYRIFEMNLGNSVFDRVGKEELMRVMWQQSGAAKQIQNSRDFQALLQDVNKVTTKITFYSDRLALVAKDGQALIDLTSQFSDQAGPQYTAALQGIAGGLTAVNTNELQSPNGKVNTTIANNWRALTNTGQNLEPVFAQYYQLYQQIDAAVNKKGKPGPDYLAKAQQAFNLYTDISHALQEIASGKQLPQSYRPDRSNPNFGLGRPSQTVSPDLRTCIDPNQILGTLLRDKNNPAGNLNTAVKDIPGNLVDLATYIGTCKVDSALGLPLGSLYTWYTLGSANYPKSVDANSLPNGYADGAAGAVHNSLAENVPLAQATVDSGVVTCDTDKGEVHDNHGCFQPGSPPTLVRCDGGYQTQGNICARIADQTLSSQATSCDTDRLEVYMDNGCYKDDGRGNYQAVRCDFSFQIVNGQCVPVTEDTQDLANNLPKWTVGHWSLGALKLSIGIANARTLGHFGTINADTIYALSAAQVASYIRDGDRIFAQIVQTKLIQMIPGLGSLLHKYGVNEQDMVQLLQGDVRPLISRIGGLLLDKALDLQPGTGALLVFPRCFDTDPKTRRVFQAPCDNKDGVPSRDPENVRLLILARAGLRKLGLTIPNIPLYFDITGSGNMLQNWGNAKITQDLGLTPNSFAGYFDDPSSVVRNNNQYGGNIDISSLGTPETLNNAFGLSKTVFVQTLDTIRQKLFAQLDQLDPHGFWTSGLRSVINADFYQFYTQTSVEQMYGGPGAYWNWSNTDQAGQDQANEDFKDFYSNPNSILNKLWQDVANVHKDATNENLDSFTVGKLRTIIGGKYPSYGSSYVGNIDQELINSANIPNNLFDASTIGSTFGQLYKAYILRFRNKVQSIGNIYGLSQRSGNNPGQVEQFLKGEIPGEDITQNIANHDLTQGIIQNQIDKYIGQFGPQWLKDASTGFQLLTQNNGCTASGQGFTFGKLFAEMLIPDKNADPNCLYGGVGKLTGNDILFGKDKANFRLFLFDKIFSQVFSHQLEQDLGIQHGTFKAIAVRPDKAETILISQGLLKASNQIFGNVDINHPCRYRDDSQACDINKVKGALKSAFLAGFFDPSRGDVVNGQITGEYTLDFSVSRSMADLNLSVNKEIDRQLARAGRMWLGADITRADLSLLLQGDGRFFTLVGLEYTVNLLNKRLDADPNTRNNIKKERFKISYNIVRASAGVGIIQPGLAKAAAAQAVTNEQLSSICYDDRYKQTFECGYYWLTTKDTVPDDLAIYYNSIDITTLPSVGNLEKAYQSIELTRSKESGYLQDWAPQVYTDLVKKNGGEQLSDQEEQDWLDQPAVVAGAFGLPTLSTNRDLVVTANTYNAEQSAKQDGLQQIQNDQKNLAQESLKYKTMDIVAFMYDQSIPVDFSRRMITGNTLQRASALTEYGFNLWASQDQAFGDFCKKLVGAPGTGTKENPDCGQLADFVIQLGNAFLGDPAQRRATLTTLYQQNFLVTRLDSLFSQWIGNTFRINGVVPTGLFKGIIAWGFDGFRSSDFNRQISLSSGCTSSCVKVASVGLILQNWGIHSLTNWADKQLHLTPGTSFKIYTLGQVGADLFKIEQAGAALSFTKIAQTNAQWNTDQFAKGNTNFTAKPGNAEDLRKEKELKIKAILVQLAIDIVVNDIFGKELMKVDAKLGLPPTTSAQILTIGLTGAAMAFGIIPFDPTTLILAGVMLGITVVFGVTKVVVTPVGTADGYYPWYNFGTGPGSLPPFPEHHTTDIPSGEFNPTNKTAYYAGLKNAAQVKVTGLIRDILEMPTSLWAQRNGFTGDSGSLAVEQIFTYGDAGFSPLNDPAVAYAVTAPAPWDGTSTVGTGVGFGSWNDRCDSLYFDPASSHYICNRVPGFWAGVFPVSQMYNAISFSW